MEEKRRSQEGWVRDVECECLRASKHLVFRKKCRDFPDGSVVRTVHFHMESPELVPHQGTKIPQATWEYSGLGLHLYERCPLPFACFPLFLSTQYFCKVKGNVILWVCCLFLTWVFSINSAVSKSHTWATREHRNSLS